MKKIAQKKLSPAKKKLAKPAATAVKKNLFVVAIGASAGGLEAMKVFFDNTPAQTEAAYVIIQHLDPTHKSLLTELLATHTKMKVFEATDGVVVNPSTVYIIPPNKDLTIFNGRLQLATPATQRGGRRPIDLFFTSLAKDQAEKSVGIVLSGTGSEGAVGLREIRAAGGVTFVQEPSTATFGGMPQAAVDAQVADYVLSPTAMPKQILTYIKKKSLVLSGITPALVKPPDNLLNKIFALIRNQTGCDFSNYKTNTIIRRISKRIALNQINNITGYIDVLEKNPEEINKLFKDFLIGVTSFFRDKEVFAVIEKKVIPYLLQLCRDRQQIRVWVCGCSTGEEAYSLAILFREALLKNKEYCKVMIFASDVDQDAIELARSGTYSVNSLEGVSAERLARFFTAKENGYQLNKEIREMVVFAHHNVIKDPPFSKMDLITCRNLLIYINSDLQKKIIPVFRYSLNPEGLLILGTSESIGEQNELFSDFDTKNKMFKKTKEHIERRYTAGYDFPQTKVNTNPPVAAGNNAPKKLNFATIVEKYLLDQYVPPSVVIDKNNEVLFLSGHVAQYLELPGGEAKLDILKMAKKGLRPALEQTIQNARDSGKPAQTKDVSVKVANYFRNIELVVKPAMTKEAEAGTLLVIFEPAATGAEKNVADKTTRAHAKGKTGSSNLQKELKITHDHLQSVLTELEVSKQDLQTTTEEFQSSNEELQSTNEELETSREELQSVNEELITVNNELQDKIEQLSQSNDDLNNLLRSIEVATIFLDRDLKIKRFTPSASKIFNLIPSDVDRPLTDLTSNLAYKNLAEDVKNALRTLVVKTTDVYAMDGSWYQMRIIPYRTVENIIEGVLVTFIEITEEKKVEESLKKTNEHLNLIMEHLPAVAFTCVASPALKFSFVGSSCEKVTGFLPVQFISNPRFWINRVHPDDTKKMLAVFAEIETKQRIETTFRWKCADGKYKQFVNFVRYAIAENDRNAYIVGVWQEIVSLNQLKEIK